MTAKDIKNKLIELADIKNLFITDNLDKIANAKHRMFGEEWQRCPCDGNNHERFCGSSLCMKDIEKDGICHCNLFKYLKYKSEFIENEDGIVLITERRNNA